MSGCTRLQAKIKKAVQHQPKTADFVDPLTAFAGDANVEGDGGTGVTAAAFDVSDNLESNKVKWV